MKSMELFGMALKCYFEGNRECNLTIHNFGADSAVIPMSVFFRQADLMEMDKTALKLCNGNILDIGAGTGDHALFLLNHGYDVTALDISNSSCEIIKKRGIAKVVCCDIFNFETLKKFDTILLLGRSIGAVGDINGFVIFLQIAKKYLKNNGHIIFNSVNEPSKSQWQSRQMSFEYDKKVGDLVTWFDIGEELLSQVATENGYTSETKFTQKDGNYLSLLTLNENG
jgi:SAM-dependent methyltransferase